MTTNSESSTMVMMVPWLHFSGGDNLLFKAWNPTSTGAIAGACIGLALLAIFERWVNGFRGLLESQWRTRALASITPQQVAENTDEKLHQSSSGFKTSPSDHLVEEVDVASGSSPRKRSHRALPPFIASYDLPRGVLFAFQVLLSYILMLAVMTFQAAYLISILFGLAIGEVLFGRGAKAVASR